MAAQRIFVFTGTSGSGRKTVAHRIAAETGIVHVSSCTDREPRDRIRPDLDYHYVSKDRFTELAASGAFIEAVTIGKHRYGILKSELDAALATGKSLYLVLNREGSDAIKRIYGRLRYDCSSTSTSRPSVNGWRARARLTRSWRATWTITPRKSHTASNANTWWKICLYRVRSSN
jgi:guanylate kinase